MENQRMEVLEHFGRHVKYPTTKKELVAACACMSEVPKADKEWFAKTLPDKTYNSSEEVKKALKL